MRLRRVPERCIEHLEEAFYAFLDWRDIERDATPRSLDSYRRILVKLAEDYPEIDVRVSRPRIYATS
jgi:hypothetical protein